MNFIPDPTKLELWDTWAYVTDKHEAHLFYLANRPGGAWGYVGHAVSTDWLHWSDLPEIVIRGPEGAWDAGGCGTGMVFRRDGRYYMSYTGALSVAEATGLLVSDDLITWTKLTPNAPFWPRSAAPPYETEARRVNGSPAWRDAYVTKNPQGEWEAVCSARIDKGPAAGRGCLARARVPAIDRWETLPPLAHTGRFASTEVPELFEMGGKYYALFSSGSNWGVRLDTPEREAVTGTFYLVADRWEGPYRVPKDDLLIGAGLNQMHSYVARQIPFKDERLIYHHYAGKPTAFALPKKLVQDGETLYLAPWDGLGGLWRQERTLASWDSQTFGMSPAGMWTEERTRVTGSCRYGADSLHADLKAPDLDLEATVKIRSGARAGLAVGMRPERGSPGVACLLDAERDEITVGGFDPWPHGAGPKLDALIDKVRRPIRRDREYHLRLLRRSRYLELFVDGRLVFSTVLRAPAAGGGLACVLESAEAEFTFQRIHALEPLLRG